MYPQAYQTDRTADCEEALRNALLSYFYSQSGTQGDVLLDKVEEHMAAADATAQQLADTRIPF